MTADAQMFSDVELTAFLDGEAQDALSARIAAAIESDAALAARLETLDAAGLALRDALDLSALNAPALPAHIRTPKTRIPFAAIAVPTALAASFALGLFVAPQNAPVPAGWIDQVASYQALYVTETLSGATQDPDLTQRALTRASEALALDLAQAPQMEGLTFKRAQMLAIEGEALVQLAYLDASGTPFALCIKRVGNDDRGLKTKMSHDLAAASWVQNGLGYVLVGGTDNTRVSGLAQDLRKVL